MKLILEHIQFAFYLLVVALPLPPKPRSLSEPLLFFPIYKKNWAMCRQWEHTKIAWNHLFVWQMAQLYEIYDREKLHTYCSTYTMNDWNAPFALMTHVLYIAYIFVFILLASPCHYVSMSCVVCANCMTHETKRKLCAMAIYLFALKWSANSPSRDICKFAKPTENRSYICYKHWNYPPLHEKLIIFIVNRLHRDPHNTLLYTTDTSIIAIFITASDYVKQNIFFLSIDSNSVSVLRVFQRVTRLTRKSLPLSFSPHNFHCVLGLVQTASLSLTIKRKISWCESINRHLKMQ